MSEHPAFLVYAHLGRFFKARGLPIDASLLETPRNKFIANLNLLGYFKVSSDDGKLLVIILEPGGKYAAHGPDLRSLMAMGTSSKKKKKPGAKKVETGKPGAKRLEEMIVLAPEKAIKKKNITAVVDEFRALNNGVWYSIYPFSVLSLDIPRVRAIPKFTIVDKTEVDSVLAYLRLTVSDLPVLRVSDPPVVWIGGRPQQVVKTESPSETAGTSITYWYLK